jgi:hypothetical protein
VLADLAASTGGECRTDGEGHRDDCGLNGYRSIIEHLGISSIGAPPGNAPRSCAASILTDAMPNVEPAYRQAYSSVVEGRMGRRRRLERAMKQPTTAEVTNLGRFTACWADNTLGELRILIAEEAAPELIDRTLAHSNASPKPC